MCGLWTFSPVCDQCTLGSHCPMMGSWPSPGEAALGALPRAALEEEPQMVRQRPLLPTVTFVTPISAANSWPWPCLLPRLPRKALHVPQARGC